MEKQLNQEGHFLTFMSRKTFGGEGTTFLASTALTRAASWSTGFTIGIR
jgi:hypothetical protein